MSITKPLSGWLDCRNSLPRENVVVMTKIDDESGVRNEQPLKRNGRLWFIPSGAVYVYYTPTHWKPI